MAMILKADQPHQVEQNSMEMKPILMEKLLQIWAISQAAH